MLKEHTLIRSHLLLFAVLTFLMGCSVAYTDKGIVIAPRSSGPTPVGARPTPSPAAAPAVQTPAKPTPKPLLAKKKARPIPQPAPPIQVDLNDTNLLCVATTGDDQAAGTIAQPFATIQRARDAVRKLTSDGLTSDLWVLIRGGTYELTQPLTFGSQDSGSQDFSITYAAYPGEIPVISGGRRITGWKQEDNGLWSTAIPEVASGKWYFRNLYVNSLPATRARKPNIDANPAYLRLTGATLSADLQQYEVTLPADQLAEWSNLSDVEIVVLGEWNIARKRLASVNRQTGSILLAPPHIRAQYNYPRAGAGCYLENARAFLDEPGEWYLDRSTGQLWYWPQPNEKLTDALITAPALDQLLTIRGTANAPVRNLHFRGCTFAHTDAKLPAEGFAGTTAGAHYLLSGLLGQLTAAVEWRFATGCTLEESELNCLGEHALWLAEGCQSNLISGNRITNAGGNGIMVLTTKPAGATSVRNNQVSNNWIQNVGITFYGCVGIYSEYAHATLITHNLFCDLPYHGIITSGNMATDSSDALVGWNHIHDVMQKLGDGGGIYSTEPMPGTVLQGNLIHDVIRNPFASGAPNNGIFFDEGSQNLLVISNVIYQTSGAPIRFNKSAPEKHTFRDNYFGEQLFSQGISGVALATSNDRYLDIPHSPSLDPQLLTIEAWIRPLGFPTGADPSTWIISKNINELTDGNYGLAISHNNVGAYLNIGGGRENSYAAWSHDGPLTSNEWSHVAMTYDGRRLSVFCNGKLVGQTDITNYSRFTQRTQSSQSENSLTSHTEISETNTLSALRELRVKQELPRTSGTGILRIGKRADGFNQSFNGLLDEVRIYSRALSAEEISTQFSRVAPNSDKGGAPSPQPSPLDPQHETGLVASWGFDDMQAARERIIKEAGPEEPYRSRFAEGRESSVESR